jgi:uncharacterized protein (DUF2147 family)
MSTLVESSMTRGALVVSMLFALGGTSWMPGADEAAPNPDGIWMRGDGNARVRIAPCGDKTCATNLWIKDTSKGEETGDKLVMSLTPASATVLKGTAFDPKRGRSYAITVIVGERRLVTRGCILGGIICRDVTWTLAE